MNDKTIVALSSGALPSGVAIIRLSGPRCREVCLSMLGGMPEPRRAELCTLVHPATTEQLDRGIVLWFPGPNSFTGEDCLEFHVHGGRGVVNAVLEAVSGFEGVRIADAGEFSRRAFENGKMDLTEVEGLADLIASETELQRRQALSQSQGDLRGLYEAWRKRIIHMRALVEAELDFSEEEDVPEEIAQEGFERVSELLDDISSHLNDNRIGEIIRDGFRIALMGKPNAGKSSLLNALSKRDIAIVTEEAGTTRDVIDAHLDLSGVAVIISDTAGIRDSVNVVELEGIRRAQDRGEIADLVVWLTEMGDDVHSTSDNYSRVLHVITKNDSGAAVDGLSISVKTGFGMDAFLSRIEEIVLESISGRESLLISRVRYRRLLEECREFLSEVVDGKDLGAELRAEQLRHAGDCIGRITGSIDVEDLLDVIFSEFCVGK